MPTRTRAEQETILRWDAEDQRVLMYTANPFVAAKWRRLGYTLTPNGPIDDPSGWSSIGPKGSITVRKAVRIPRKQTGGGFQPRPPVAQTPLN